MELFLIRHAIAEDRSEFLIKNRNDSKRPLTASGKRKFKKLATHYAKLLGVVDVILTSPLQRAKETSAILAKFYPKVPLIESNALTPNSDPTDFEKWCEGHLKKSIKRIVIIGHEPHLGILTSWLLVGTYKSCIHFKKGGIVNLSISGTLGPERAILQWALTPKCLNLK
jgi:phosphohistidine phosphatase